MERMESEATAGEKKRGGDGGATAAIMTAEWMVAIPEDLAHQWYVMSRPAGQRCLVCTGGAITVVHSRGRKPRRFPSALPGGSRAGRSPGRCVLDCIWNETQQTYFVLDALVWKDYSLVDCPTEFRFFWLRSKLAEGRAADSSSTNPCRFVAPPVDECSAAVLRQVYAGEAGYDRDGLLFYHRESLYEAGPNPLVLLWSDSTCSKRFYNYGSTQMAEALEAEPSKAEKWRTAEVEAAHTFKDIVEQLAPAMDTGDGVLAGHAAGGSCVACAAPLPDGSTLSDAQMDAPMMT